MIELKPGRPSKKGKAAPNFARCAWELIQLAVNEERVVRWWLS